jgi:hypothetical protein
VGERTRVELGRDQILGHRRRVGSLDRRLPAGPESLRRAAWAGLQDSMPRAAVLSLQARVEGAHPSSFEDPSLVQVWGPRFSAYVVAAEDRGVFTLGRLPEDAPGLRRAQETADRLEAFLDGRRMAYERAGRELGVNPNALRYAAPTGRLVMRWDGARSPVVWMVPAPTMDPREARLELGRRFLHVLGPSRAEAFGAWAGLKPKRAQETFDRLAGELMPVRTPFGNDWILAADEPSFRAPVEPPAPARLLPSGDAFYLAWGPDRELLVPDGARRPTLWTSRVWPGALLVAGEIVGVWRRQQAVVSIEPWRRLTEAEHSAVEAEAASLPLPRLDGPIATRWVEEHERTESAH